MKFRQILFSIIFIFFIFMVPGSYFIINPILETNGKSLELDIGEKRKKVEFQNEDINNIGLDLENYLNDRIPYRNYLIMVDRKINSFIDKLKTNQEPTLEIDKTSTKLLLEIDPYVENYPFITSYNGQVIIGQSNWLYYNRPSILGIYQKEEMLDDDYLNKIIIELKEIDRIAKLNGKIVQYIIAPEKQEVYEEYMPTLDIKDNLLNLSERITKFAVGNGINIIYPRDLLKSYKNIYRMYKKYDSHWNQISAYLITNEFYKNLGLTLPNLNTLKINIIDEVGNVGTQVLPACRDLVLLSNMNYEDYPPAFEYEILYNGIKDNPYKDKYICVIGDSFCIDMLNIIKKDFSNLCFVNGADELPKGDGLYKIKCSDIIVYELVERHISEKLLINLQNIKKALIDE